MTLGFNDDLLYEQRLLREAGFRPVKKTVKGKKALSFLAKKIAAALKKRPGTAGTSSEPSGLGQGSRAVVPLTFTAREDSAVLGTLDRHEQIERNIDIDDPDTIPKSLKRTMPFTESRRFHYTVFRFMEQRRLKGEKNVQGLNIKIEKRKWDQKPRKLRPYGYIDKTKGVDGDNLDVFLGPNLESDHVFVIHSLKLSTKKFDEDKVMLGFNNGKEAKACFIDHYKKPQMYGGMDYFNIDRFKTVAAETENQPKKLVASMRESYGFSMKSLVHNPKPNTGGQANIFEGGQGSGPQRSTDDELHNLKKSLDIVSDPKGRQVLRSRVKDLAKKIKAEHGASEFGEGGPGSGPHQRDAVDVVGQHAKQIPKKVWIEKAGASYVGAMDNPKGGKIHGFRDPKSGSTMWMKDADINSSHDVKDHMNKSRSTFKSKESRRTREGRIYYARPLSTYESQEESDDLDLLESEFDDEEIIVPRSCESGGDKDMSKYHKMVDESDAVAIRPFRTSHGRHRVTAGVFSEAQHALHKGIPVRMIYKGKLHEVKGFRVRKPARADGDFADVILKRRRRHVR